VMNRFLKNNKRLGDKGDGNRVSNITLRDCRYLLLLTRRSIRS